MDLKNQDIDRNLIEGDSLEISPLALATCEDIAIRVMKSGGAALLIDYGENYAQGDSIRAFYKHQQYNFLSKPGLMDVTADVDFAACKSIAMRRGTAIK